MKMFLAGLGLSTWLLINSLEAMPSVDINKFHTPKSIKEDIFESVLKEIDKGNIEKAIDKLEFLTAFDDKNADNHVCLGLLYEIIGDKERAASEFRKSLSL